MKENTLLQSRLSDYDVQLKSNQRYQLLSNSSLTGDLYRLYAKYCQKMESHSQKVQDIEQSHELYQQVAILQGNISKTTNLSNK